MLELVVKETSLMQMFQEVLVIEDPSQLDQNYFLSNHTNKKKKKKIEEDKKKKNTSKRNYSSAKVKARNFLTSIYIEE